MPPSSGGAADRLNPVGVCDVCVSEALCAEVASGTNLYLDLKLERETWWQREKGAKLPQTGGSGESRQATTECIQHGMFGLAGTNRTI